MRKRAWILVFAAGATAGVGIAQEQPKQPEEKASQAAPATTQLPSASQRLTGAKTIFVKKGRGSEIPYNVISEGLVGWGKYALVGDPAKADLIVDITAPEESSGVSVSSSTSHDAYGKPQESSKTTRDLSASAMVTMTVYDAKNNVPLWRASEQAKSAMKQKARQDNMVEAAQKVLTKFRERVEPVR